MIALKAGAQRMFRFAGRAGTVYELPLLQNWPVEVLEGLGHAADADGAAAGPLCKNFRKIIEHYNPSFADEGASDLEVLALTKALQDESAIDLGELLESRAL